MKLASLSKFFLVAAVLLSTARSQIEAAGILELAEEADLVLLGETVPLEATKAGAVKLGVRGEIVLKGDVPPGSLVEMVFLEWKGGVIAGAPPSLPPEPKTYAFWFLKRLESGEYSAIPRAGEEALTFYHKRSGSPVPRSWTPPAGVSAERLLLEATLEFYRSNYYAGPAFESNRRPLGANWMTQSLQYSHLYGARDEALRIVDRLMESTSASERNIGTVIGIRMSHDPAMAQLERNLEFLRLNEKVMGDIRHALEYHYNPNGPQGPMRIENLIRANQRARIPRLDIALSKAVGKLPPDSSRLPLAALLLDSPEEKAVRHAASRFYGYALLARGDGTVAAGGTKERARPLRNEQTKAHNGHNEDMPAKVLAEFWRGWWADNQAEVETRAAAKP